MLVPLPGLVCVSLVLEDPIPSSSGRLVGGCCVLEEESKEYGTVVLGGIDSLASN